MIDRHREHSDSKLNPGSPLAYTWAKRKNVNKSDRASNNHARHIENVCEIANEKEMFMLLCAKFATGGDLVQKLTTFNLLLLLPAGAELD